MKIRILSDLLRLRLSKSEIDLFAETGSVQSKVNFNPNPLVYQIIASDSVTEVITKFEQNCITVEIPSSLAKEWTETDKIGFENTTDNVTVLVEKDFQCLHREPEEEKEDSFPHPQAKI